MKGGVRERKKRMEVEKKGEKWKGRGKRKRMLMVGEEKKRRGWSGFLQETERARALTTLQCTL